VGDTLEIQSLGGLTILRNGTAIAEFDQRKVPALLVYLACAERPQSREVLAELFWEDRPQSQSQSNLRVALSNLRKTVGPFVDITRDTAGMTDDDWQVDAFTFEERLAHAGKDLALLEEAIALYRGDFLEGFYIDSHGFEDWALLERERLRFRAMEALDRLIDCHVSQRNYTGGIATATRLLHLDPLREKTHRQLMHLLALSGEREAALGQYDTCRRMLADEFSVQPAPETTTLFQRIRAGELVPVPVVVAETYTEPEPAPALESHRPRHNLPAQPTSFVGREPDIAAIIEQLEATDCRLLTLVGPGGVGKTRLALAVAERLVDAFAHGAFFVPLAPLVSPEGIVSAIATAVGFQFYQSPDSTEQQLLNFLREKEMLLVLDNFEHLLDGASIVDRILAAAPGVTVLATSREPLTLGWEWLYEVGGMLHPDAGQVDDLEGYSAVRLFVERARRVQPGFRLADESAHVIRICQLVEGMPLGIEIAAAWLRLMPCEAIAAELLDLESLQRDTPERHASLRALFDQTWQRLPASEHMALMRLSVFQGGFSHEMAETVAQTTLPHLATLVNKSLLHCDRASRRYSLHELLRQYAAEQLERLPDERNLLLERFVTAYAAFLCEQAPDMLRGQVQAVRDERDNLQHAWTLVVQSGDLLLAKRASLRYWFFSMGPNDMVTYEGDFERAAAALRALPPSTERDSTLGQVLVLQAKALRLAHSSQDVRIQPLLDEGLTLLRASGTVGELAFALRTAGEPVGYNASRDLAYLEESLALWQQLGNTLEVAGCLDLMGNVYNWHLLDLPRAKSLFEQALALFRQENSLRGVFLSLMNLGLVAMTEGRPLVARQLNEEALHVARTLDDKDGIATILNNLVYCAVSLGDGEAAEQYAQQALDVERELGNPRGMITVSDTLGDVRYLRGDYAGARTVYRECLERVVNNHLPEEDKAMPFSKLGFTATAVGDYTEAGTCFRIALELAVAARVSWLVLDTLLGVAWLYHRLGKGDRALELFGVPAAVAYHDKHEQDEARLHAELEAEFGLEAVAEAIARGKDLDLLEVAREVLAELEKD